MGCCEDRPFGDGLCDARGRGSSGRCNLRSRGVWDINADPCDVNAERRFVPHGPVVQLDSEAREGEEGAGERGGGEDNLNDDDTDDTEETTTATTAVVPGSVAVLGPQTNVKNSIESIELISNATSQNAQSWGIEDGEEKNDDEENPEEETTTTKRKVKTKLRSSSKNKKEKHLSPS
mgnify:CR=1 FL=1